MLIEFVILHYQNYNDTLNCVESIQKLNLPPGVKIKIVVLDNNSPNHSGIKLQSIFKQEKDVSVQIFKKNMGFSGANNIGYVIAKKNNADIIIMSNNDIIIEDKMFVHKLRAALKNKASILCPDIINARDQHQNPMRTRPLSSHSANKSYFFNKLLLALLTTPFIKNLAYAAHITREQKWQKKYYSSQQYRHSEQHIVPHGAFLIYTKKWIKSEDIAFPSNTFMYLEEDFLSIYALRHHHITYYINDIQVRHLEGRSTNYGQQKLIDKLRFKIKLQNKALKQYLSFLKTK